MRKILAGLILTLLLSCATSGGPRPVVFDRATIITQLSTLPGAVVQSDGVLQFSYPEQALFGAGAVLPLPGGSKLLDPLAAFFLRHPGLLWQVDIQVGTGYGTAYDQALAEKRSELLATYLLSKGVDLAGLQFQPAATKEESLVFILNLPQKAAKQ